MADIFQVVGQRPTTEFLGGSETRAAVAVGITTKPNSIYVEFLIPRTIYSVDQVRATAIGWATIFETVAALPWVVGVEWSQDPAASGQLADMATITVTSTSGNSTGTLSVAVAKLGPQLHKAQINALHKQLDDAEEL